MAIEFSYLIRDRGVDCIKTTFIPNDGRLTTYRKTLPLECLTVDSTDDEVHAFIQTRAPLLEWEEELMRVDPDHRAMREAQTAKALKMNTIITL